MNLILLLPAAILLWIAKEAYHLYLNIQTAKTSGLKYIISPIYGYSRFWLTTDRIWTPMIRKIFPHFLLDPWLEIIQGESSYLSRYSIHERLGTDTFVVVSPTQNILFTADADVINQMTTRRNDFPKPVEVYKSLDIYGKNVVSNEGSEWRRHRKITAPPFSEKSNQLVWMESLYQAQTMLTSWVGKDGQGGKTIEQISRDAMRLSLHVISRAGFDVRCLWPGVNDTDEKALKEGAMSTNVIPEGHVMSYTESMEVVLHRIIAILILPEWIGKLFRWEYLRKAHTAYHEWGRYMEEIYQRKYDAISGSDKTASSNGHANGSAEKTSATVKTDNDLMDAMIKGSGMLPNTPNHGNPAQGITQSEIMGNSFVFMLAGHETAANTITHSILYLAMNPGSQQRLQADIDRIVDHRPVSDWDYDHDMTALFGGMPGAVMNESLRLLPPVVNIPKCIPSAKKGGKDQRITIEGKECVLPTGTYINLCAVNVHRNKKYWPHGPNRKDVKPGGAAPIHPSSNLDNDLEEFKPERWILDPDNKLGQDGSGGHHAFQAPHHDDEGDLNVDVKADTAATLYRPPKGAYIPFSEGYRACLGKRFAQVEILATLAVLFRSYSVELAVEEFASEEEVRRWKKEDGEGKGAGEEELKRVWGEAREAAETVFRENMGTVITIQMRKGKVPVRWVRRGEEVFNKLVEDV